MEYRDGMTIDCPACGKGSVVKTATKMDGWRPAGRFLVCALCGHQLAAVSEGVPAKPGREDAARRAAAQLLGDDGEDEVRKRMREGLQAEKSRFCKDCGHFHRHPFKTMCLLHERETDPMGDCASFEAREVTAEEASEDGEGV